MTCNVYTINYKVDVLKDGDFYIYLERGKNNMWQPLIGMASFEDKISQIQGADNNNKLLEQRPNLDKTFDKALKTNDVPMIFEYLDKPVKTLEDGTFEIKVYKPSYVAGKNKGISLPLKRL